MKSFIPAPKLSLNDINPHAIKAKYAVRGAIPILADELKTRLPDLPFDRIINANIGNPQQLKQKPLTWYRQVLALLQYNELKDMVNLPKDVVARSNAILESVGSIGAYSHSQGDAYFRQSIANFIKNRDDHDANIDNIYITSGASTAVNYLITILTKNENSAFLIPIPQYPLYTASIALNNAQPIGYYLQEDQNWATSASEIKSIIEDNSHLDIKALVIINPGNPTGAVLQEKDIIELIDLLAEKGLVIIADEVYQENVFEGKFISVKKVLCDLLKKDHDKYCNVQLASLHSVSKGITGECGQRGGYVELFGFDKDVEQIFYKLASINLCSVVSGQALMELMVNPPKKGDESYDLYIKEKSAIKNDLKTRAELLYEAFCSMDHVSCKKPMGAMYLFPKLEFTQSDFPKLFKECESTNAQPDDLYCVELLKNTGICCIPGNGFGQVEGTYHLRTTFLAPGTEWIDSWKKFHQEFIKKYKN